MMHENLSKTEDVSNNDLIEECQGLVHFLARQVKSRSPSWVEMDDLVGYGQVGLMQAARDFDRTKGIKFSTFAYYRIRGSIFDGVNKLMWFRTIRDPEVKYNQMADSYLETTAGDEPAQGHSAASDLTTEANWFARSVGALAVSYLAAADGTDRSAEVPDDSAPDPSDGMMQSEMRVKLAEAIDHLEADCAALVRAVYYEEQTLQEAANQLKISKSWASRLHARALEQMGRYLRQANLDDAVESHGSR